MANTTWTQTAGMVTDADIDNVESYSEQALASKNAAAISATAAATSASNAAANAASANTYVSVAQGHATAAAASAGTAQGYAESADISTLAGISGAVSNVSSISGDVSTVSGISGAVSNVAADLGQIDGVYTIRANVSTVAGISGNVTTVAGMGTDITNVLADATDIGTVAGISAQIQSVADNTATYTAVEGAITNIDLVAGNATNINLAAGRSTELGALGALTTEIDYLYDQRSSWGVVETNLSGTNTIGTVAGIASDVDILAGIATHVSGVYAIRSDVSAVAADSADIGTVATSIDNVNTVSTNIAAVNNVSTNMTDVTNAVASAATATTQAGIATTKAGEASTSATNAATSKTDSDTARDASQAARDTTLGYKNSAETAATSATNTAAALTGFDLAAIAATKTDTAVDVFVYDTSLDSDGGAWRKRTQGTSWYNETLNTATRGSRKEFPAVAVIVAETNKVTIYDGDDPSLPMWMVFESGRKQVIYENENSLSSVSALNGQVWIGSSAVAGHLSYASFLEDVGGFINTAGYYPAVTLLDRNVSFSGLPSMQGIVNRVVNDVAMTVLPNAPIDAATGLPVPTIAVATAGGVSVIKDDGTVVDVSKTSGGNAWSRVAFTDNNQLKMHSNVISVTWLLDIPDADTGSTGAGGPSEVSSFTATTLTVSGSKFPRYLGYSSAGQSLGDNWSSSSGLTFHSRNASDEDKGMVAYATSSYNTGWMNGDIKLATLSDTDDTNVTGSELVTNGTFASGTTGWTFDASATDTSTAGFLSGTTGAGTNRLANQAITTVIGKAYRVEITTGPASTAVYVGTAQGSLANGSTGFATSASKSLTFIATTATTYLSVMGVGASVSASLDNITVRLAEEDRSVNANGLQVFGTITKTAVETGADLVGYSGFSASNYLEQPINADLDFGTGDFAVMVWAKPTLLSGGSDWLFDTVGSGALQIAVNNSFLYFNSAAGNVVGTPLTNGAWSLVCCVRSGSTLYLYINGDFDASVAASGSVDSSSGIIVGNRNSDMTRGFLGSLALLRISATAPTAAQIAKIYNDEKYLFQENAQATLYGTSDAVTALAHDDATDLLHVGTNQGRSVFQGLRRVSNTTDAVGAAISASNNLVAEG